VILLRSLIYNALFYIVTAVLTLSGLFLLLSSSRTMVGLARLWGTICTPMLAFVCGTKSDIRGAENIPATGCIIAAKHQSTWETFALVPVIREPVFIYKRELNWVPVFGWLLWKADQISVNRGKRSVALADMTEQARRKVADGRRITIFPEGTRTAPGAPPAYKFGVAHLYAELNVPVVPVALNSGLFWGRRSLMRYPGTIRAEFLEPIQPGLSKDAFHALLQERIETATNRLLAEGEAELRARGIAVTA
jgi:1-acyl-sn-glycerol-3-phosphate acyltransferase